MKNERSNAYLKTFPNTPEGIAEYRTFIKTVRTMIKGGRFLKMFRGPRTRSHYHSDRETSTHFDVYLHPRRTSGVRDGNMWSRPMFFNFRLAKPWELR